MNLQRIQRINAFFKDLLYALREKEKHMGTLGNMRLSAVCTVKGHRMEGEHEDEA